MKDLKFKDSNGNDINISLLGFFRIPDLKKEYIMYGLNDENSNNEYGHVLLGEVVRNDDNIQILGILDDEKDMVVAYYNEISNQIGGNENE